MFNNQIIAGSSGQGGGSFYNFTIDNSVRMSDASNSQLYWQAGTASSDYVWTMSLWMKKYDPAGGQASNEFFSAGPNGVNYMFISMNSNQRFYYNQYGSQNLYWGSGRQFRDPNAWFHLVLQANSQEATQADRLKLWLNGVDITSEASETSISTSVFPYINQSGYNQYYGGASGVANGNPGCNYYLADINFCDGQSYDASYFGEFNNGVWIPKDPSVTYGNNGYRLEFKQTGTGADASGIGADTSGNGNHFTIAGLTAHDVVPDSPTNNFATWNVLQPAGAASGVMTLSEGNLKATGGSSIYRQVMGNMSVLSGKWYTELYITDAGYPSWTFGWTKATRYEAYTGAGTESTHHASIGYFTGANLYITDFGSASVATRTLSYSSNGSPTTGSIIGCAADFDNGKLWWSVNGTWVDIGSGAGDPANDTNPASTYTVSTYADDFKTPHFLNYNGSAVLNTGQDSTFAGNTTAGGNSDENGYGDFKYSVPSGFLAMCSANLPEPAIGSNSTTTSDEHFNTVLYTGTGSTQSITGVGFQPDWVFVKRRAGIQEPSVTDSVRGVNAQLRPAATNVESAQTDALTSFDSDGFTLGADTANGSYNNYTDAHVAWNWKAGGTAVSNSDGSTTSNVSANQDAGFSVVSYTGTGANATIGHGLSSAPEMIIIKARTRAENWLVYHKFDGGTDGRSFLNLNTTGAKFDNGASGYFQGTPPTASVFYQNNSSYNVNTDTYIAYCFHSVEGFSKVGSYVGNSSTDGPFSYTGFRPAWVMLKRTDSTASWLIYDSKRDTFNQMQFPLFPNLANAEYTSNLLHIDFLSNGFKVRNATYGETNASGGTYLFLAFAEAPAKYSNAR